MDIETKSVENIEVMRIKNNPMSINKRIKFELYKDYTAHLLILCDMMNFIEKQTLTFLIERGNVN